MSRSMSRSRSRFQSKHTQAADALAAALKQVIETDPEPSLSISEAGEKISNTEAIQTLAADMKGGLAAVEGKVSDLGRKVDAILGEVQAAAGRKSEQVGAILGELQKTNRLLALFMELRLRTDSYSASDTAGYGLISDGLGPYGSNTALTKQDLEGMKPGRDILLSCCETDTTPEPPAS